MKKFIGPILCILGYTLFIYMFWIFNIKGGLVLFSLMLGGYIILVVDDLIIYLDEREKNKIINSSISVQNKRFEIAVKHLGKLGLTVRHHFSDYAEGNKPGERGSKKHDFICSDKFDKRSKYVFIFNDDFTYVVTKYGY